MQENTQSGGASSSGGSSKSYRNTEQDMDLPYIGMAIGFFSRLSLNMEVPLEEAMELGRFAQQIVKDAR